MQRQITRTTKLVLQATSDANQLNRPLFAINWFNTRALWLYNLYNWIAAGRLFKNGGKVLFKGQLIETLIGSPDQQRELLLVVNYPSGEHFLNLIADRFFQVTSLLRLAAVRNFSFVLNRRVDGPALLEKRSQDFVANRAWAVHLYKSDRDIHQEVEFLRTCTAKNGITLHFASLPAATVHSADNHGNQKPQDHVTDRVVILEAEDQRQMRAAVLGGYQEFLGSVSGSYVGTLQRMM